ncbi:MAG: glycosyltransferase, partial [Pseudomonadota bacterium]
MTKRQYQHMLTIAIPCYNGADFMRQSLDSVLAIDRDDIEIIVIDNKSTDHSLEIARSYLDKRLRIIENPMNYGVGYSWYRMYADSQSKYICSICVDDVWIDDRLDERIDFMETHQEITVLGGSILSRERNQLNQEIRFSYPNNPAQIITKMPCHLSGALIRSAFFDLTQINSNPFHPACNDFDFLARCFFENHGYPFKIYNENQLVIKSIGSRPNSNAHAIKKEAGRIHDYFSKNYVPYYFITYLYMLKKLKIKPSYRQLKIHYALAKPFTFKKTNEDL